ncbi:nucleoside triphosphate pyrophosphohydrolase [Afifella marina]|uniref:Nucleoside triphosphate pyrophosphohydrolase n=1 Tax=Afifella marina DSM 2698 TaxID=1120955 RepID=A0A1G5NJG4_AFIMA|nr:nucleoside triphosphate pyrophosphohydrolase [Afifella marina]MBK1623510.1 nucleoside triphosphate pyrophosphohydrolase [Afifella marina DSM 2698]MBK1626503.1 nucleoside triphosphate pyrophosphohydrolase [Afifella marina]MBK5916052.1 nucleoside triphosphate pyrophosphohydrolase [Afifella marina]RAI18343.1 nucleoside triphosphate pyrophosphohydrolase [Afifella marina DSM 2698]SCZ36889.1 ATP diphosphatase [Afifella marina DSM 2698]
MSEQRPIDRLISVMADLRDPERGCPWDVKQDFSSIAPYTIEEAYEVADAIERADLEDLREELGDLLLQVVFHARMAEEAGAFAFDDVADAIVDKMVRRHPHIFGDGTAADPAAVKVRWDEIKAEEKARRREKRLRQGLPADPGLLADVPRSFPGLLQALKMQEKAAKVGFDWPDISGALDKLKEEIAEVEAEIAADDRERLTGEIGDALFAMVNVARKSGIDPDAALRRTNEKFRSRFEAVEQGLSKDGRSMKDASLDDMEGLWQAAKSHERSPGSD